MHDSHLGGGIGVGLLSALIDSAEPRLGLTRLQLTVFADNQRAIALYQRFGFAVEGTLRAYPLRDDAVADALRMARLKD